MADIVNLRQIRKQMARTDKEQQAEANRQKFGRSKAEKQKQSADAARIRLQLDGHRREDS